MKRNAFKLLAALLLFAMLVQLQPVSAGAVRIEPKRVINLVYDDSGSMIWADNNKKTDRWCQAKYAMEVFAALLGKNDVMNIYYMSEFDPSRGDRPGTNAPEAPFYGRDGGRINVERIHNMTSYAGDTPWETVEAAYRDLAADQADEKWLVILTDGAFQRAGNMRAYFSNIPASINVMFLSMGDDAPNEAQIVPPGSTNVFFAKATSSKDILNQITGICTRVFNCNKLGVNSGSFSFDVPMSELVVFAQGKDVKLGDLKIKDSGAIVPSASAVTVQYSESPTPYDIGALVDKDLKGIVATYSGDIDAGSYKLSVSGADTIEVFYKPNVDISAYLTDLNGVKVNSLDHLRSGDYIVEFGFVKTGTDQPVADSSLLGNVAYRATIRNNGEEEATAVSSGDKVHLDEGSLDIEVSASFLEYNHVSATMHYNVFEDKQIQLKVISDPEYGLSSDGVDVPQPIQIEATIEGQNVTAEQWKMMDLPLVTAEGSNKELISSFTVEKSDTPGVYNITPVFDEEKIGSGLYSGVDYTVVYEAREGDSVWAGNAQGRVKISDVRSWWDRNRDRVKIAAIIFAILLWIYGYMPWVKKYFPRTLKSRPTITRTANRRGNRNADRTSHGKFQKKIFFTIIPYFAERGTIRVVPQGTPGVPTLEVKALGGSGIELSNTRSFAGRENITFNGQSVREEEKRKITLQAATLIDVTTQNFTYSCSPVN